MQIKCEHFFDSKFVADGRLKPYAEYQKVLIFYRKAYDDVRVWMKKTFECKKKPFD